MDEETFTFTLPLAADWMSVLPEIMLTVGGAVLIVLGAFLRRFHRLVSWIAVLFFLAVLVFFFVYEKNILSGGFNEMLNAPTYFWILMFCGLLSAVMGSRWLAKNPVPHSGEFFGILAIAVAALSIFTRSMHLMLTFVALEASAICFYVLIAWSRRQVQSLESSIRYLILSGVSGAFFLLGIAFIYGVGLKSGVNCLYYFNFFEAGHSYLFYIGLILVLSGVFFKLSAFPFQFWAPDVYQGAPVPVAAFMAAASKSAAFLVAYTMLYYTMLDKKMFFALSLIAAAGIVIGNFGGLTERNTKRIIGFSGIANAGYLMVLLVSLLTVRNTGFMPDGLSSVYIKFYLLSYVLGVYGIMFVQNMYADENDSLLEYTDFKGMWNRSPLSVGVLSVGLASLAGIPPTAGFFAKLLVIIVAISAGFYWLAAVLILGSAASIYYYFKWMRAAVEPIRDEKYGFESPEASGPVMLAITIGSLCMGVMVFTFLQSYS